VLVAGRRYAAAAASGYRQALDLRRGLVTTTATFTAGGRVTRLAYEVALTWAGRPRLSSDRRRHRELNLGPAPVKRHDDAA
jgi:hypothetical protein